MKKFLSRYWPWALTLALGVAVFLFWRFRYPFALTYQEQLQLFLFDGDYFSERMAEPGGLARYIAEFLVQFYNGVTIGALILAVLFMLLQRLTWQVMKLDLPENSYHLYPLSFVPVLMLWYAMGDESVMLTYAVALLMALASVLLMSWMQLMGFAFELSGLSLLGSRGRTLVMIVVFMPVLYWLIGPMALLVAACMVSWQAAVGSLVYTLACILVSAHFLPYPLLRIELGIGYYRFPETIPYILIALPVVVWLLAHLKALADKGGKLLAPALSVVIVGLALLLVPRGFDQKKYELIEYDYLVRVSDWNAIIAKAEKQTPDLPMSVSATNLALAMTNQLGKRAFDFYQRGSEGLLPRFERNFATTPLTGEIYFRLGLVNTAQRLAFEAMETIPNYNKSARVIKRLAETNLVNGQYDVARKYLKILNKTIFYRPWAKRTLAMLGDEQAINSHPLYGTLRQYQLKEDFLFSDQELDKICGQLFVHNQQNQMAAQYLLMMPLLEKDVPRFMNYVQYVQSKISYNPRAIQEGIAFGFMQQHQQPPQGVVSQQVLQQINEFVRIYAQDKDSPALGRFKNTVWYYLMVGK